MEIDAEKPVPHSYTILRIKRKRNEEPLDALVVESGVRRKKSRGGIGVFQFAQTVENDAWQDEEKQKGIQDQISRLARESSISAEMKPNVPTQDSPSPVRSRMHRDDWNRRYAILDQDDRDAQVRKPLTSPPKVISSKDLPQKKSLLPNFKMYDAVPAVDKPTVDSEMEKFLPMLNDYLISHDVSFDTKEAHLAMGKPAPASTSTSNDYVWDVFYHRPATLSEWNEAANVGTLCVSVPL
ncbi:hypothetical protein L208DRAFT_1431751 [Tricholoma matsutake]|nr:hypothetical protein L208DRAFT_1431751 [Tricholoma matsutake 945]